MIGAKQITNVLERVLAKKNSEDILLKTNNLYFITENGVNGKQSVGS